MASYNCQNQDEQNHGSAKIHDGDQNIRHRIQEGIVANNFFVVNGECSVIDLFAPRTNGHNRLSALEDPFRWVVCVFSGMALLR